MQILCAQNGRKFDFPIFLQCLYKHGMLENLKSTACGVVDSIHILQLVYPGQKSYALANIYASVCSDTFENHEKKLADSLGLSRNFRLSHSSSISCAQPVEVMFSWTLTSADA